jgi:CheY-like chemotaxis protein
MGKQVLVIDDDQNAVKYLSVLLDDHGYVPVAAHDGNHGLQKVKQCKPDLIVLDVMMPKKSGFVLFKQLKKDETFEKPYDTLRETLKAKIREMREEGLVRPEMFMDKPVDPDLFIEKVHELLGS